MYLCLYTHTTIRTHIVPEEILLATVRRLWCGNGDTHCDGEEIEYFVPFSDRFEFEWHVFLSAVERSEKGKASDDRSSFGTNFFFLGHTEHKRHLLFTQCNHPTLKHHWHVTSTFTFHILEKRFIWHEATSTAHQAQSFYHSFMLKNEKDMQFFSRLLAKTNDDLPGSVQLQMYHITQWQNIYLIIFYTWVRRHNKSSLWLYAVCKVNVWCNTVCRFVFLFSTSSCSTYGASKMVVVSVCYMEYICTDRALCDRRSHNDDDDLFR